MVAVVAVAVVADAVVHVAVGAVAVVAMSTCGTHTVCMGVLYSTPVSTLTVILEQSVPVVAKLVFTQQQLQQQQPQQQQQ